MTIYEIIGTDGQRIGFFCGEAASVREYALALPEVSPSGAIVGQILPHDATEVTPQLIADAVNRKVLRDQLIRQKRQIEQQLAALGS